MSSVICNISKTFYLWLLIRILYTWILYVICNVLIMNENKIYSYLKQTDN